MSSQSPRKAARARQPPAAAAAAAAAAMAEKAARGARREATRAAVSLRSVFEQAIDSAGAHVIRARARSAGRARYPSSTAPAALAAVPRSATRRPRDDAGSSVRAETVAAEAKDRIKALGGALRGSALRGWAAGLAEAMAAELHGAAMALDAILEPAVIMDGGGGAGEGGGTGEDDADTSLSIRLPAPPSAAASAAHSLARLGTLTSVLSRTGSVTLAARASQRSGEGLESDASPPFVPGSTEFSNVLAAEWASLNTKHVLPAQRALAVASADAVRCAAAILSLAAAPLARAALREADWAERAAAQLQLGHSVADGLAELAGQLGLDGEGGACLTRIMRAFWQLALARACADAVEAAAEPAHAGAVGGRLDEVLDILQNQLHGGGAGLHLAYLDATRARVRGEAAERAAAPEAIDQPAAGRARSPEQPSGSAPPPAAAALSEALALLSAAAVWPARKAKAGGAHAAGPSRRADAGGGSADATALRDGVPRASATAAAAALPGARSKPPGLGPPSPALPRAPGGPPPQPPVWLALPRLPNEPRLESDHDEYSADYGVARSALSQGI
ncbi:hypothetical protein T492DRAFT_833188 [Pavlovales sp. CCMP2436]|nr:hypothetical protein T492DRAFT_833188 [Pavlovales sp. CCMP2436]